MIVFFNPISVLVKICSKVDAHPTLVYANVGWLYKELGEIPENLDN
jgi:hypothetical protein